MTPIKGYGQISDRMFEIVKENVPSKPFLKFVHNFLLGFWNLNRIFENEIWLDFSSFFSLNLFEKS